MLRKKASNLFDVVKAMLKKGNKKVHWLVVWETATGDFKQANAYGRNAKVVEKSFESKNRGLKVIHIGEGALPPKTFRSLAKHS